MSIPILAVTDEADPRIHSESLRERMGHVAFAVSCGDLPASYLEFIADALNRPVYYVLGNHAEELTRGNGDKGIRHPAGAIDLGGKVVRDSATGLILAGFPGSPRYCEGEPVQYSEWELGVMAKKMVPRLQLNRLRYGRALDLLVTHAPPRDINDRPDPAHRGFEVLRRFLDTWRPPYHLHGHVHLYDRSQTAQQRYGDTDVINVFPYRVLELEVSPSASGRTVAASP
ncbi:MAG: metallophosphoesterase [Chloroflexia bacterium]|nr:metallophosphoesterase [Chloroflexia bacterium]